MHRNGQVGTGGSLLSSIQRNSRDTKDSDISHWMNRARMLRCDFDQTFELQSQLKTVSIENQAKKLWTSTLHTSHFLVDSHLMTRTCVAQLLVWRAQRAFHIISCVIFMRSCCVFDSPRLLTSSSCCPLSLLSSCSSTQSSASSSTMWWTNSLCTPAKEALGTLAEDDPLTEVAEPISP